MPPENKSTVWDIVRFAVIVLVIVIPIRAYVAQPFIVSGSSMDPTFRQGDYLIIDELTYHFREPKRGEVVVFRYPKEPSKFFIKRIIGLPGEIIRINENGVSVTKTDGTIETLNEPYAKELNLPLGITETLTDDEYYVLGDNRSISLDSRFWGPVTRELIKGRALLRLLPPQTISILPGNATSL